MSFNVGCTQIIQGTDGLMRGCGNPVFGDGMCQSHLPKIPVPTKKKKGSTNTKGGDTPRLDDDAYYTPDPLARVICRTLRREIGIPQFIAEPSAGRGAFVRAARAVWGNAPHIVALEKERAPNFQQLDRAGADEVIYGVWERAHDIIPTTRGYEDTLLVLGNPPYDPDGAAKQKLPTMAETHVTLALQRMGHFTEKRPVPRFCAFLLRGSFLAGKERSKRLHARGGLRWVFNIEERPSYTDDGKTDGAEYALLVWQAGFRGRYEGDWLSWEEEAAREAAEAS
jgi:hypothetical protein